MSGSGTMVIASMRESTVAVERASADVPAAVSASLPEHRAHDVTMPARRMPDDASTLTTLHTAGNERPSTQASPADHPRITRTMCQAAPASRHLGAVVYFSSASGNTARFVGACRFDHTQIAVYRIPLRAADPPLEVREPYILIVPTYGGGDARKAVPVQVKRFLNDPDNRAWIRGVIAAGNTNFGEAYGAAGDIVAAKCHVPFLYRFELMGTPEDATAVRRGVVEFFTKGRA